MIVIGRLAFWKTMNCALSFVLASVLVVAGCFGQASEADRQVRRLVEYWRWKQYWFGTTELGAKYSAGREFRALLFWRTDQTPPSVGFCSADLGVCQFYPNLSFAVNSSEMQVPSGDEPQCAFERFLATSFAQKTVLVVRSREAKAADYATEMVKITLPALDPPEAIRNRRVQPRFETDALIANLSCLPDQPGCKVHLMVPFYSHSDPFVPVFRKCSGCPDPKPMVIFMRLIDGNWWHGARDFDSSPDSVSRTRSQIQKALLVEVSR